MNNELVYEIDLVRVSSIHMDFFSDNSGKIAPKLGHFASTTKCTVYCNNICVYDEHPIAGQYIQ